MQTRECDGLTATASAPRYPRGTVGFDLLDPEALPAFSNQELLPGEKGLQKALMRASWGRREEDQEECLGSQQEEEDRGSRRERSDDQSDSRDLTAGTRLGQRDTTTAVFSRDRRIRRQQDRQSGHALGRAWPWQVRSHSGWL
ncbi:hypothetical protein NDU88_004824 [Pleurodeles waltl]|uniref:Uncharacterized protein n=1 Tax=Pleurodeles waltl TaxID=8319 RepID=A0AAV7NKJ5_PLEWA|nr:hypothetical protein NDU88_004824 [Pleurodeles waltl]